MRQISAPGHAAMPHTGLALIGSDARAASNGLPGVGHVRLAILAIAQAGGAADSPFTASPMANGREDCAPV